MMKKLFAAGLTAGALTLGIGAISTPANAQIYFGVGPGWGYHHYHPHYGYWAPGPRCGWVTVKKRVHGKWRWRQVRRCW